MLTARVIFFVCILAIEIIYASAQVTPEPCSGICPRIYAPVCASNDQTYVNECEMNFASCSNNLGLTVVRIGQC